MSTWVLGVSALYHDAAAALLRDGEVVGAVSEERFSRVKHDASLPVQATRALLAEAGITAADLHSVVFYEKPLRKYERLLVTHALYFPRTLPAFVRSQVAWLTDKLWLKNRLCTEFGVRPEQVLFCEHHLAHAASAFYGSDAEEAAVLVADGVGEWATTSLWKGDASGLHPLAEVRFPHSLGLLYSAFTAWAGFAVNEGEYKLMGLASYGTPTHVDAVRKLIQLHPDGGFAIDLAYVRWHVSATQSFGPRFEALFGPARPPGDGLDPATPEGLYYANVAASVQVVLEESLLGLARNLHERTGCSTLAYAGGVALNGVANQRLAAEGPFQRMVVHPAAGDAGGALGAAWWAWVEVLGGPRPKQRLRPGLAPGWSRERTAKLLNDLGQLPEDCGDAAPERAAEDLAAGSVVAWQEGPAEWGPRALGHRSILADPSRAATRDQLNHSVKFREPFRPFAPAVLPEDAAALFDLPAGSEQLATWMLLVAPAKEGTAERLPATTHVDGTARVQVVDPELSPVFTRLVRAFRDTTGVPAVLNTSFNLRGEPIVHSPVDALATFHRSHIDVLYVDGYRMTRRERGGG